MEKLETPSGSVARNPCCCPTSLYSSVSSSLELYLPHTKLTLFSGVVLRNIYTYNRNIIHPNEYNLIWIANLSPSSTTGTSRVEEWMVPKQKVTVFSLSWPEWSDSTFPPATTHREQSKLRKLRFRGAPASCWCSFGSFCKSNDNNNKASVIRLWN